MNRNRLLTAAVAACCLVAVGTAATTMDSSVTTEPEEAVQFDRSALPVGARDGVGQLRRQVSADDRGGASDHASAVDGSHRERQPASKPKAAESGDPRRMSASESEQQERRGGGGGDGPREAAESLLERLLELLRSLLAYLLAVFGLLALGGAAYLLRDRLGGDDGRAGDDAVTLGDPAPRNDVSRAWYEMVERVGLADRHDLTPDEHAERAVDRGIDHEAAAALTRAFEEVRYGDAPVTDERRRRARERVQEIRAQARQLRTEGGSER